MEERLVKTPKERKALIEENAASVNREAFNIFKKLIMAVQPDDGSERQRVSNESLLADIFGNKPVSIPRDLSVDSKAVDLMYRFLDIARLPENFAAIESMARRYRKGAISRSTHLEHCWFLMAHEAYILEERLKRFLNCVAACAEDRSLHFDKAITKTLLDAHKERFGDMVAARGMHVHQRSTIPRELKRVALIELLKGEVPVFAVFERLAVANARKQLISRSATSRVDATVLIATAVHLTEAVWKTVVRDELKKFPAERPAARTKKR